MSEHYDIICPECKKRIGGCRCMGEPRTKKMADGPCEVCRSVKHLASLAPTPTGDPQPGHAWWCAKANGGLTCGCGEKMDALPPWESSPAPAGDPIASAIQHSDHWKGSAQDAAELARVIALSLAPPPVQASHLETCTACKAPYPRNAYHNCPVQASAAGPLEALVREWMAAEDEYAGAELSPVRKDVLEMRADEAKERVRAALASAPAAGPVPMILHCPTCRERHVDAGEFATKPHHTHACQSCGMVWRPAIVPTVGVQFLPGFKNRTPTRIVRNPEGDRCAICDGTYAHVHGYDDQGEVPGMFDGSDWPPLAGAPSAGRPAKLNLRPLEEFIPELLELARGEDHDDPNCPQDDTCRCANIAKLEAELKAIQRMRAEGAGRPMEPERACDICSLPLSGAMIGNGTGNRFAHPECWWRQEANRLDAELKTARAGRPMTWTRGTPTEPGWYWFQILDGYFGYVFRPHITTLHEIEKFSTELPGHTKWFAGPIPEPETSEAKSGEQSDPAPTEKRRPDGHTEYCAMLDAGFAVVPCTCGAPIREAKADPGPADAVPRCTDAAPTPAQGKEGAA